MNLQLNLATKIYVDFRKVNLTIALLLTIVLVWLSVDVFVMVNNYGEIQTLKGNTLNLRAKGGGAKISDTEYSRMLEKIKFANDILEKRSYDWLSLLDNMEQVMPSGVSLNSLVPEAKGGQLKLSGSAVNFAAVRTFVENLEKSNKFTEVFLTDQMHMKGKGINFSVTCRAVP